MREGLRAEQVMSSGGLAGRSPAHPLVAADRPAAHACRRRQGVADGVPVSAPLHGSG
jgi:hypothetical protein